MKRRSFLAMLGLAPVAAARPANASITPEVIQTASIGVTGLSVADANLAALTRSWICPDYEAACLYARASGRAEPSVRFHIAHVEPSADNPNGTELQLLDDFGRVVMRQWNRK